MNNSSKINYQSSIYTVTDYDDQQRLDNMLLKILKNVTKNYVYKIIRNGEVRVNKKRAAINFKVNINDQIRIPPIFIQDAQLINQQQKHINASNDNKKLCMPSSQNIINDLKILFEDEYYLIIDKPYGVACHGGSGISFGIIEQLRMKYTNYKFLELAHRLDKDTSGILIIAKKRLALINLQELMRNNNIKKHYTALVYGLMPNNIYNVKVNLVKYLLENGERRVRVDKETGQFAYTIFTKINYINNQFTLLDANIKTGRTHQIRVHLQHLGYPIAMDDKYGDYIINKQINHMGLKRMFLHASNIQFIHPITNALINITSSLPMRLQAFINTQSTYIIKL